MASNASQLIFAVVLAFTTGLKAQDFRGSVIGTVSDAGGGRIGGAVIDLGAHESSVERKSISDGHGQFRSDDCCLGVMASP